MEETNSIFASNVTPFGATVTNTYLKREITVYGILDHEMKSLSSMGAGVTFFSSVGSGFVSCAVGIETTASFADKLTPTATILTNVGVPAALVIAAVFFLLAIYNWWNREDLLKIIRKSSTSDNK